MNILKIIYLVPALFVSLFTFSQNHDEYQKIYPKDDAVTLTLKKHIDISETRGRLSIKEYTTKKDFFITNNQLSIANESVSYNTFNSIIDIKAYTKNSNGIDEVKEFTDKDVLINGIFFNDQKEKNFTFPNVRKGSSTSLNYTREIKDPHFLPSFFIGKNNPIEKAEFSISFPSSVEVAYKTFNLDTTTTHFEVIKTDNKTTFKWTLNTIPKISRHYDFSPSYYIPQIIPFIKFHTKDGYQENILSSSTDLYSWYSSLISNINNTDQTELETLTISIIKGLETDKEKAKKIFYYVQNEINYIAFEDGLNGFIPRDAKNVFIKKYGDCKDMANLLNEMMRYAGLNSHLVWIGTRSKPYSYSDVPTPIADNHMITAVQINDDYIFLDATAKYLTFNYPSPFIQGKEALIGIDNNNFKILNVPEVEASENNMTIYSKLKLKNNTLIGKHSAKILGHQKLDFLHSLEGKKDNNISFLYNSLSFGNKKTGFDSITYENLSLEKDTITVHFNTSTRDYSRIIDNKIYLSPILDFNLQSEIVKDEKKNFDKKIDYKYQKNFIYTIEIPEKRNIESIPENITFNNDLFSFSISYKLSDDKKVVTIEKTILVNSLKIEKQKMNDWNNFVKSLNSANRQAIILTQHKT